MKQVASTSDLFLRHVGWLSSDYIALYPKRQKSAQSPLWVRQIRPGLKALKAVTTEQGDEVAMLLEVLCSNLGQNSGHHDWGLSWLSSVPSGKPVAGSSPDEVDLFNWSNPTSRTMALGSTQPLTEMSTRNVPGGKGRPAHKGDLIAICEPIVWKMW
jgi:hypothetical protein